MEKNKKESVQMTQESWEHSLWICVQEGNTVLFNRLWKTLFALRFSYYGLFAKTVIDYLYTT